jgi:hypothetical protein
MIYIYLKNMTTIDIVKIFDGNPMTSLTGDYQSSLISKIKERFTTREQQLFIGSFYCYLNYGPNEFVIELGDVWKWISFGRKGDAKKLLERNFTENVDYKIEKTASAVAEAVLNGGQNRETIKMTVRCFKMLCLVARTDKAFEIHGYYVKLEEITHEVAAEESESLRNQLLVKDQELTMKDIQISNIMSTSIENEQKAKIRVEEADAKAADQLEKKEKSITTNFKESILYAGYTEKYIIKAGYTDFPEDRLRKHKKNIGEHFTFDFVYKSPKNRTIERELFNVLKNRRISKVYNEKNQTELFQLDDEFTIDDFNDTVLKIKHDVENDLVETLIKENYELKKKMQLQTRVNNLHSTKFIARNILTGEEIVFHSYADAKQISGLGPHSLPDNYLNKPIQSRGHTYRECGNPYWEPPQNFKFDPESKPSSHKIFCKSVHKRSKEVTYYNSVKEASEFLGICKESDSKAKKETTRRTLNRSINGGKITHETIGEYDWSKVDSCGHWVYPDRKELIGEIDETKIITVKKTEEFSMSRPEDNELGQYFEVTSDNNDKLLVKEIRSFLTSKNLDLSTRYVNKVFISWGVTYLGNKKKLNVGGISGVGYTGIRIK